MGLESRLRGFIVGDGGLGFGRGLLPKNWGYLGRPWALMVLGNQG